MFLRKRSQRSDGLVAVPLEQMDEWIAGVINPAWEQASSGATPDHVNLLAKVALGAICGRDEAKAMAPGAPFLAYNLYLLGYWSRDEELRIQQQSERNAYLGGWIEGIRESAGLTWFESIQRFAQLLADDPDVRHDLADSIAPGAGDDFRSRLAVLGVGWMTDQVETQHPGTSALLTSEQKVACWTRGYWMHVAANALDLTAQAELAAEAAD